MRLLDITKEITVGNYSLLTVLKILILCLTVLTVLSVHLTVLTVLTVHLIVLSVRLYYLNCYCIFLIKLRLFESLT